MRLSERRVFVWIALRSGFHGASYWPSRRRVSETPKSAATAMQS